MCDFTRSDDETIRDHARATAEPSMADAPFHCPPDTVLDVPVPPGINRTRKIDWKSKPKVDAWKRTADALIKSSGQYRAAWRNIDRYELVIVLNDQMCGLDPDAPIKTLIDYLRRIEVITNDAPRNARQITIRWAETPAEAPEGVRLIVKPIEDYDARRDFAGSLEEGYRAIRKRKAAGGPGWEPKPAPVDPWISIGDAAANVVGKLKRGE